MNHASLSKVTALHPQGRGLMAPSYTYAAPEAICTAIHDCDSVEVFAAAYTVMIEIENGDWNPPDALAELCDFLGYQD